MTPAAEILKRLSILALFLAIVTLLSTSLQSDPEAVSATCIQVKGACQWMGSDGSSGRVRVAHAFLTGDVAKTGGDGMLSMVLLGGAEMGLKPTNEIRFKQ